MAFVYEALDSFDFERLCANIVEEVTGTKLSVYARGRDGGIDASDFYCENPDSPTVIVQAKHYFRSQYASLRKSLADDVEKLKRFADKDVTLYLMTSMSLTKKNKDDLRALGNSAGFGKCEVWAEEDITRFLEDPAHAEMLRTHFKLWLTHSGVLQELFNRDVFIDCEYYLCTAEEDALYFVPTDSFRAALDAMDNSHAVMIVGDPGTGKTMLSEMIALAYAAEGYSVRYTTSMDVHDVLKVLSPDKEARELVVLDDFLGSNLLEVSEYQVNAVCSLVHHVKSAPGKRVVLNSRSSILNEAKRRDVSQRMEKGFRGVPVVNTNHLSEFERARILISVMRREGVPASYVQSLMESDPQGHPQWFTIIRHDNFNPRLVDFACRKANIEEVKPSEFPAYLENLLDNPVQVWENEFERLTSSDRCLLHVLYTMPKRTVDAKCVKEAYEYRVMADMSVDVGSESFEQSLSRLNNSLVRRTIEVDGSMSLSTANPSINDYIASELRSSDALCARMIQGAKYLDQVYRIACVNQSELVRCTIRDLLQQNRLLTMPALNENPHELVLLILAVLEMFDDDVCEMTIACFDDGLNHPWSLGLYMYIKKYAHWLSEGRSACSLVSECFSDKERLRLLLAYYGDSLYRLNDLVAIYEMISNSLHDDEKIAMFTAGLEYSLHLVIEKNIEEDLLRIAEKEGVELSDICYGSWCVSDETDTVKLRDRYIVSFTRLVNDIFDDSEYVNCAVLLRYWDVKEAKHIIRDIVSKHFKTGQLRFLVDQDASNRENLLKRSKTEKAMWRLFKDYVDTSQ